MVLFTITFTVTTLQFIFPEIIPALDRNQHALMSGEFWRLITPLFIQPYGLFQCVFNSIFFFMFVPIAEHLYGRRIFLIYFIAGLVGQLANYYWEKGGGGSSTALYGVLGSLYAYAVLHRANFPKGYLLIPLAGFSGATILCFFEDGHAPSLLAGGLVSLILSSRTHGTAVTPSDIHASR